LKDEMNRRQVRVLHVGDYWYGGGAEKVFRDTVGLSDELGFTNKVFTSENSNFGPVSYVFSLSNARKLSAILSEFQPDVVHLQNFYHKLSPSVLWSVRRYKRASPGTRIIFTAHDMHLISPNSGFQFFGDRDACNIPLTEIPVKIFRKYDQRGYLYSTLKIMQHVLAYRVLKLYRVIDLVVTPSYFLRDLISRHRSDLEFKVLRNPINQRASALPTDKPSIAGSAIRLVFFGRLSPEKGLGEFLRLCAPLFRSHSVSLDIFGDGPEEASLKSLSSRLGADESVVFRGALSPEHVQMEMKKYSVLVLPSSWYENAPLVICEAAAAGLPVLVRRLGGAQELADEVKWGVSTDFSELDQTYAHIRLLASHAGENQIVDADQYSVEHYAQQLEKIYRLS